MADDREYFVLCKDNCKFPAMTKEQALAAIAEATGKTPTDIDAAFISKIKEINKGETVQIWIGATAEYNALVANGEKRSDVIYIKTDDSALADFESYFIQQIASVNNEVAQVKEDFAMSKSVIEADIDILKSQTEVNKENITTVATWVQDEQRVIYNLTWDMSTNEITNADEVAAQLYADITGGKNVEIRITSGESFNQVAFITDRKNGYFSLFFSRMRRLYTWVCNGTQVKFWEELYISNEAVIEEGEEGGWHYRKWASGIAEMWGVVACSFDNNSLLAGSLALPFGISNANITATIVYDSSENINAMRTVKAYASNNRVNCHIYSNEHFDSEKTLNVYVSVKGNWK